MKKSVHYFATALCIATLALWCALLTYKFSRFGYYDWDLAFFTQAAWSLLRGETFVSLVGINYFGDHSYFFTFFILPIFAVAPSPLTLLYLKVFALVLSGFLLYLIAKEKLGERPALYVLALYFLFPGNIFALLYEFNLEAFAPPLILLSWQAARRNEFKRFLLWTILLVSIKENMFLMAIMLGCYGFLKSGKGQRRPWVILNLVYSATFLFLVLKIIPLLRDLPQHAFMVRYSILGQSMWDLFLSPLLNPKEFFTIIFDPQNQRYILDLFGYLLLPALISAERLLPAAPILLQHILSIHPAEHSIFYHYVPTISPFIFLALIKTLEKLEHFKMSPLSRVIMLNTIFVLGTLSLFTYAEGLRARLNVTHDAATAAQHWQLLKEIPPDAPVVATFGYLAPLSTREKLYSFHKVYDDKFQEKEKMERSELNTNTAFVLPADVQYALIDWDDIWLNRARSKGDPELMQRIEVFLKEWKLVRKIGRTTLLFR